MRRSGISLRVHVINKKVLDRFDLCEYYKPKLKKLFCKCYERDSCQGKRQEYSVTD